MGAKSPLFTDMLVNRLRIEILRDFLLFAANASAAYAFSGSEKYIESECLIDKRKIENVFSASVD